MKLKHVPLVGLLLIALALGFIALRGQTYTAKLENLPPTLDPNELRPVIEQDKEIVTLDRQEVRDGVLYLTFTGKQPGRAWVRLYTIENVSGGFLLIVHRGNIITFNEFLGDCTGGSLLMLAVILTLLLLFVLLLREYIASVRENQYRYRNILLLGLLVFLAFLELDLLWSLRLGGGLLQTIQTMLYAMGGFAIVAFPVAFVLSILVTISNLDLLRKEGRSWRNLLGFFLGLLLLAGTLFPELLTRFLQQATFVNVHNEQSVWPYLESFVEHGVFLIITYLECILLGAIVHGYKAARHVPAFDKDYMLILGCMIRKDGTLTPLLRGRVDRAIEFAKMQKEATGKDLIFVPSGGQGPNEVIAEAQAMYNYLKENGVPDEQILVEDRSRNTYENFTYSMELIREHAKDPDPQIAFSTTNYHVFRSGFYAAKQGIKAEGIGSKTKVYYWVNAYIREFIATLRSEWKTHLTVILVSTVLMLAAIAAEWASAVLW